MLNVRYTVQFKKDYKLAVKRGYNPKELEKVIVLIKIFLVRFPVR